jgi:crotonobetainyl-CoA:carnitine CoA-transferase CaiB-like acyl-CoA transferase
VRSPAPWTVGADTDAVMHELGLHEDEIKRLRRDGVL